MIYKRCSRCRKRLPEGSTCNCWKKSYHKEYDRISRDKQAKAFYCSSAWTKKREEVLNMDENIDVYVYMTKGEIILADTVHHITPLRDDWSRRLDEENLMSLSHETHSKIERRYKSDKEQIMRELHLMLKQFRAERMAGAV